MTDFQINDHSKLPVLFRFVYTYTDYDVLLEALAAQLQAPVKHGTIQLPSSVANGTYAAFKLPNGIQVSMVDCILQTDWFVQRKQDSGRTEFYTLRFNELDIPGSLEVTIGDSQVKESGTSRAVAYLTSSRFNWSYHGTKGTTYKGIDIMFTRDWIAGYMGIDNLEDVQVFYVSLQSGNFNAEPLDSEYRRLMHEITQADRQGPMWLTIVQNRVLMMMERFFLHAFEKMKSHVTASRLSSQDINRVMEVEKILTADLLSPAQPIAELARQVSISVSKLKSDFKSVYGFPLHEYYRKSRLNAARDKLLTGKFSIKEVAMELGYSNLSNFTNAFRKEFGMLPSALF